MLATSNPPWSLQITRILSTTVPGSDISKYACSPEMVQNNCDARRGWINYKLPFISKKKNNNEHIYYNVMRSGTISIRYRVIIYAFSTPFSSLIVHLFKF